MITAKVTLTEWSGTDAAEQRWAATSGGRRATSE